MEKDDNPKYYSLVVSAVTPGAPHRVHLAISQCSIFADSGHLYLPRFLVSTDRDSHASEELGCKP